MSQTPVRESQAPRDSMIRVLVVDDSAVARWMVQSVVDAEPDMKVAGTAHNGRQALERIESVKPDIVLLDVEMPEMDGIEALKSIRRKWLELPVIMFSTLTEKSASITLEALALGATDYVTKPHKEGGREAATEAVRSKLIPQIRALGRPMGTIFRGTSNHEEITVRPRRSARAPRVDAVVIGASTGGPNALAEVIPLLPETTSSPIFIVQHMPPVFTQMLADRLDGRSHLRVVEASPGMRVRSGTVYIAPGGIHMAVKRVGAEVLIDAVDDPPEHSVKPAVDVLIRSALNVWGGNILGVILTGMGEDGLSGCQQIVDKGGTVIAQDSSTSLVWGMPGAVAKAGLAAEILPIDEIALAISRYLHTPMHHNAQ